MQFQPSASLRSRTYVGLIVAQFLAAFNDQTIHASAMFYAIHEETLSQKTAISLMPVLFYAPWAVFCTLAGYLADRFSKQNSLVFWKVAEIGITLVALLGFCAGTIWGYHELGTWIVLSTVFLMGTHSAFFVPAKYGVLPEILQPQLLSKGNGILESTSFLAVILGTVSGGYLSSPHFFKGQEYYIGLILVALALVGAGASLLIERMPAANPGRPFPTNPIKPLLVNLRVMLLSRPLLLSIIGIAFFTFMVAFMRATMYMHGESQQPRWDERETSTIVATVALGVGLGSPLAGFLSGGKVELGLVPLGAVGMIVGTAVAAFCLADLWMLIACLVAIGFFSGFYIVPLYTLLQHRAPKTSKGDLIATSNFINVTGAIVASILFYVLVLAAEGIGIATSGVPMFLFLGASAMTLGTLILLCRQLPDFFVRALLWMRAHGRHRLKVVGVNNLPSNGPAILATNCDRFQNCMQVVAATDRFTRFILIEEAPDERPAWLLRYLARRTGLITLPAQKLTPEAVEKALDRGTRTLEEGNLVGVTADGAVPAPETARLVEQLRTRTQAPILPVYLGTLASKISQVVIGQALRPDAGFEEIRQRIRLLGEWLSQSERDGGELVTSRILGPATAPQASP